MNGWQRFGLLVVGCFAVMVLFPQFENAGWTFIGLTLLIGAGVIMLLSLISNMFAIYRFEGLNKLVTLLVIGVIAYVLLWFFPLKDHTTPIERLRAGQYPTQADISRGLRRLTFNFDFVRRNARRAENFSNQELQREKTSREIKQKVVKKVQEEVESFEIIPEE